VSYCTRPGCGAPVKARRLCNAHYLAARRSGNLPPLERPRLSDGWQDDAACRDYDPALWFDPVAEDAAVAICATCPVQPECLERALTTRETFGVWGGFTTLERRRLRRAA
jgi:WhiB family transcriptional regulator, redox-sensing transcriptional regulator